MLSLTGRGPRYSVDQYRSPQAFDGIDLTVNQFQAIPQVGSPELIEETKIPVLGEDAGLIDYHISWLVRIDLISQVVHGVEVNPWSHR